VDLTRALPMPSFLQTAVELSPGPTLVANRDWQILLVNHELTRQFGYAGNELVGRPLTLLLPEPMPLDVPAPAAACARHALVARRKDGSPMPVDVQLRRIQADNESLVLACLADRTNGHAPAAGRVALEEQLAFERFVAQLSAEFISLPDNQVVEGVQSALARTGECFGCDGALFFRIGPDGAPSDTIAWAAGTQADAGEPPTREAFPWSVGRLLAGEHVTFSTIDDVPEGLDRDSYRAAGTKSAALLPLTVDGRVAGAMALTSAGAERPWPPEATSRLAKIRCVFAQVLARQLREAAVRAAFDHVQRLRDRLQVENVYLRKEERDRLRAIRVVGESPAISRVLTQVRQVAPTDATVLLRGETGTGKELLASYIHELSARRGQPMVRVSCAAIPATLIESELFGRERGAFTGALARQAGRFELADRSTIFLDEIGDLPADVQVKLLRVLEERTIERLGSARTIAVDVRIIAATHRDLEQQIAEGHFREDLYYRLNVFPVDVPPLRERAEDIPLLLWRFVEEFSNAFGKRIESIDVETLSALQAYSWPGNIRELRNVIERAMITATGRRLVVSLPPTSMHAPAGPKLVDVEREHIREVLATTGWRVRGEGGAAERLGLKPTTLETRIAKLGLRRPGR
jgi:PAS domain S-box-containing protein